MIEFEFVPFHTVSNEIVALSGDHMDELEEPKDHEEIGIDWDYYLYASQLGKCWGQIARKDRKIIAYSFYTIDSNPNYKKYNEAQAVATYVSKKHRGKLIVELLQKATDALKNIGVNKISMSVKDRRIGRLLSMCGYEQTSVKWSIYNG